MNRDALEHVRQGWTHLQLQRPLAAWASWQRALRADPEDRAAREALAKLADAADLPSAARKTYRFRQPRDEGARRAWDAALQGRDLQDLGVAADAFRDLASADPADPDARYNLALCLAWSGRNAEAISALDEVVRLDAPDPDRFAGAVEAWILAEVLRQGAGAEALADDVSQSLVLTWGPEHGDPTRLAAPGLIRPVPNPGADAGGPPGVRVFEWLDRPMPGPSAGLSARTLPRLLATVIQSPDSLRLSTPRPGGGFEVEDRVARALGDHPGPIRRETAPLPIRLMDADVWTFRLPAGLEEQDRLRLMREAVEAYFEEDWPRHRRQGLAGPSAATPGLDPAEAARHAAAGDAAARARLAAVVDLREQLGERPGVAPLYAGYPFDRLRRRLGLEPDDPASVDPADITCMGLAGLSGLDPDSLDPPSLLDALRGASSLRDPDLAARFLAPLIARHPDDPRILLAAAEAHARTGNAEAAAPLAREALRRARAADDASAAWEAEACLRDLEDSDP